ncbi:prephenate dehydratase [Propionibacteriaceae bacterium G1746]|uniref:prephenate dehydratase n=1 Tax=Aestuariimicrobium sp. G57 TaxID=3418485 RepID=UPI003C1775A7
MQLGFFGPVGTFTHQALLTLGDHDHVAYASVVATLNAVRSGEVEAALVPIENSVEGGVSATLDNLGSEPALRIVREVLLPVQFGLYAKHGTRLEDVKKVLTHPTAAAQVRHWLADHLPDAVITEGGSTAGAAEHVAAPDATHDAAVCARIAGEMYGLEELAGGIADNESAVTRFVLVARPDAARPTRTGADKTTMVLYPYTDRPGGLLDILEQFAARGINLTRLESRPTKTTLGQYCFSIDAEGHIEDERMAETLLGLHRTCREVVFLGSYPRADEVEAHLPRGASDHDYRRAHAWLAGLR